MSSNVTVGTKLMVGVGSLVLVVVGIASSSLYSTTSLGEELARSTTKTGKKLLLGGQLAAAIVNYRASARGFVVHETQGNKERAATLRKDFETSRQSILANIATLKSLVSSEEESQKLNAVESYGEGYASGFGKIVASCDAGKVDEAYQILQGELNKFGTPMWKAAQEYIEIQRQELQESAAAGAEKVNLARWAGIFSILIALGVGAAAAFVVRGVSNGLRSMSSEVGQGAHQITSAAGQVSSSSQSLAQGASEQAAALEETAASSEELSSMTRRNAENSKTAAEVMITVDDRVAEGNRRLDQMVASMAEIATSSNKISKIIKVIDEIAFQTNILALNAAVEAARAGEAGMGFAVVADEVRNLAQRSAQAAKDTAALIEESIAKSNEGGQSLNQVADVIRSITESTSQVKIMVDEVNLGSQEQAKGIQGISASILQMQRVTQATAAQAEESAASSEEVSAQAQTLNRVAVQLTSMVGS